MKELELKNCKFKYDGNEVSIELLNGIIEPKKLYKYYSLSKYSLQGLENSKIYFSHAHLLNDFMGILCYGT